MLRPFSTLSHRTHVFSSSRWWIVLLVVSGQLVVLGLTGIRLQQPSVPAITLVSTPGKPNHCRVDYIAPFSDAWLFGLQPGAIVPITGFAPDIRSCLAPDVPIEWQTSIISRQFVANALSLPMRGLRITLAALLALIFNLVGAAVFLRAENRPASHVTYGLFTCTAVVLCLLSVQASNVPWVDVLLFVFSMIVRGLAAPFVCLFPAS